MKCAIMQPTYVPWLGYFDLIDMVDIFVFLDNVKLEKSSWHVRNKIKTPNGELYLTISVKAIKGRIKTLINEAQINDSINWRKKHIKSLYYYYKKAKFFDSVFPFVDSLILSSVHNLVELNIKIITEIANKLKIKTKFIRASELKNIYGKRDNLLVSICKNIGCNEYISPRGSAVYLEKDTPGGEFPKNRIQLYYQNYEHPVYNQLYGEFIPYISIIDLLFNHGFGKSLKIIISGRRKPIHYLSFRQNSPSLKE